MAGTDSRVTFPPIHKSSGPSEVLKYYLTVPLKYIHRLGEQYRNDFEMFGYEYLGAVKTLLKQSFETIFERLAVLLLETRDNSYKCEIITIK